jgi:hypothetical protein
MIEQINKPRFSKKAQERMVYRITNGPRLFYGCHGDSFYLVAGYLEDLWITHDIDQSVVKWTRPAGAKPDDATGGTVQDGLPVDRHWIWKRGRWFCDPHFGETSENLRVE